jgi:hypothetical protein
MHMPFRFLPIDSGHQRSSLLIKCQNPPFLVIEQGGQRKTLYQAMEAMMQSVGFRIFGLKRHTEGLNGDCRLSDRVE